MAFGKLKLAAILGVAILLGVLLLGAFADDDRDIPIEDVGTLHVAVYVLFQDGTRTILTRNTPFDPLAVEVGEKAVDSFTYVADFTPAQDLRILGLPDADATTLTIGVLSDVVILGTPVTTTDIQMPASIDATAGTRVRLLTGTMAASELSGLPVGGYTLEFTLWIAMELVEETGIRAYTVQWPKVAFRMELDTSDGNGGGNGGVIRPLAPQLLAEAPVVDRVLVF